MPTVESNKSRYVIPDDLSPSGIRCVVVPVPDDPQWIAQFLGSIWRLSLQTHYERDEAKSGIIVAARWRQVWNEVQMALCGCGAGQDIININTVNNFRFNIQTVFNVDGLDGVAPDRPDDKWDADTGDVGDEIQQRQNALCLAALDYVNTIAEDSWRRAIGMGILDVASIFPITFLASPINGLVYWGALALLTKARIDALNSANARLLVACCLREALEGVAISEASFNTALDSCGFGGGTDEELAREIIASSLQDQTNWLMFVRSLGAYFAAAGAGVLDCPCDGWQHCFDFTLSDGGWQTDPGRPTTHTAFYTAGVGWQVTQGPGASFGIALPMTKDAVFTDFCITRTGPTATARVALVEPLPSTDVDCLSSTNTSDACVYFPFACSLDFGTQAVKVLWNTIGSGLATLESVCFRGTGTNPFI